MAGLSFEELNEDETEEVVIDTAGKGLSFEDLNEDGTEQDPEGEDTVELNFINSQMYDGMTQEKAIELYNELKAKAEAGDTEGFANSFLGGLTYTNPDTGLKEGVPTPEPDWALPSLKDVANWDLSDVTTWFPQTQNLFYSLTGQPEKMNQGPSSVSPSQNFRRGLLESGGDALVGVANVADSLINYSGNDSKMKPNKPNDYSDLTGYAEGKVIGYDTSESIADSLIADGGPMAIASLGAGKKAFDLLKNGGWLLRTIGTEVAAAFAGAATMGTDEETLLMGENAAFPIFKGLDLKDESRATKGLETRVNALAEGLGLSTVFYTGAKSAQALGVGAYNLLLKGIFDALRPTKSGRLIDGLDKQVYDRLMTKLSDLPLNASPTEISAKANEIAVIVEEHKEVILKLLDGTDGSIEVGLDTISALIKGSPEGFDGAGLLAYRRGASNFDITQGGTGTLDKSVSAPQRAVDTTLAGQRSAIVDAAGDGASETSVLQTSTDAIVDEGQNIVTGANKTLAEAEEQLAKDAEKIIPTDPNDLEFIDAVSRLEEATGLTIGNTKEASLDQIKKGLKNAFEAISNEKNTRYLAIKGGNVDPDGIIEVLDLLTPQQLDNAFLGLPSKSPLGVLMDGLNSVRKSAAQRVKQQIADGVIDEADAAAILDQEVTSGMSELLSKNGMSFEKLYTEIRPAVSGLAEDLYNAGGVLDVAGGRVLRKFIEYIDGSGDYLGKGALDFAAEGDESLVPAVTAAKEYYTQVFAPFFRGGGVLEDYANLYTRTIGRTKSNNLLAGLDGTQFKAAGYNKDLDDMLVNNLLSGGGNPDDVVELVRLLNTEDLAKGTGEQLGRAEAALDYMIFDVVNTFADNVRTVGMQAADFSAFSSQLQQYSRQINKAFPEKAEVIQQLVKNLDAAKGSQTKLADLLEAARLASKQKKEEVQQTVISNFLDRNATNISFNRGDDVLKASSNPMDAFNSIFSSSNSVNDIRDLLALANSAASGSEKKIIIDGLKLAYNKHATKKFINASSNLQGVKDLSIANIEAAQQDTSNLLQLAREIYSSPADKEFVSTFEQILDLGVVSAKGQRAKPIPGDSSTAYTQAAMSATQTGINLILGPLTRGGTRIRTGVGALLTAVNPDRAANQILINLLADPEYFLELAAKFNKTPADPLLQELLEKYLMSSVIKGGAAEEGSSEVEDDLVGKLDDQMGSVLGAGNAVVNAIKGKRFK